METKVGEVGLWGMESATEVGGLLGTSADSHLKVGWVLAAGPGWLFALTSRPTPDYIAMSRGDDES